MKRLICIAVVAGSLWAGDAKKEALPPQSVDAPSGKPLYKPVREPLNAAEEIRIQQKDSVIGGRGVPMHSYGDAKEEPAPHGDHR